MTCDFTLDKYQELCQALTESGYKIKTVREFLESPGNENERIAIIRHDVDRKIQYARRMAELERTLGIRTSFYFRYPCTFYPEIVKTIQNAGHEIGYHYETLSKARGNPEEAIALFEDELRSMRRIADIRTICMHGSPLSPFNNRDLWKTCDFKKFNILGEASITIRGTRYYSDTGRTWSGRNSLRDGILGEDGNQDLVVNTTDELITVIRSREKNPVYLTIHPERWASGTGELVLGILTDFAMNMGKKILRVMWS